MSQSSPLTAARAAHSAAQAKAAQAAAEVERLEAEEAAKSVGRRMAEAAIEIRDGGSGSLSMRLFGQGNMLWHSADRGLMEIRRAEMVNGIAALIDAALAERSAAPQPAELPEGETPEAVAEQLVKQDGDLVVIGYPTDHVKVRDRDPAYPVSKYIRGYFADALRDFAAKAVAAEREAIIADLQQRGWVAAADALRVRGGAA